MTWEASRESENEGQPARLPRGPGRWRRRRGGYVLVFFAMILFGLMAVAALVIDVGFARLAQRRMQAATDAAALEGLRFRDELPPGYSADPNQVPEEQLDRARREQAARFVAWMFDDNFDPADGDAWNQGAGPNWELSGNVGAPELNAGLRIAAGSPPVYKPRDSQNQPGLELNLGDLVHGDQVSGIYLPNRPHGELADYTRSDFVPASVAPPEEPPPQDGTEGKAPNSAYLVRMRRTNSTPELNQVAGVSTSGSSLPLLFGLGSTVAVESRSRGITVRATSIAEAQTALTVGVAVEAQGVLGIQPLALTVDYWNAWQGNSELDPPTVQPDGQVVAAGVVVGRFFARQATSQPWAVGLVVPPAEPTSSGPVRGFVPLYGRFAVSGGVENDYVVAFGAVDIDFSAGIITLFPGQVAARNASAAWLRVGNVTPDVLEGAFAAARPENPLRAPALVR